jgi:hypothetical protein
MAKALGGASPGGLETPLALKRPLTWTPYSHTTRSAMRSHMLILSLTTAVGLSSMGCIKKTLLDGQIESTRYAAGSGDTVYDYDVGKVAIVAGLGQFEGLHALGPDSQDALYLLAKLWTVYGNAFVEDEMQIAQDAGNEELAEVQRGRARMAYDRAVFFGLQLVGQKADGFQQARKNATTLDNWLKESFKEKDDAPYLLWTGAAWASRVGLMAGDDDEGPGFVSELFVGVALLERAVALDPSAEHYTGPMALAAYHARSTMAELDESKKLYDEVLQKTQGKALLVPLNYGIRYACVKGDATLYQSMLDKVLKSDGMGDPDQRAANGVAKRLAKRWLGKHRAKDQCGIDLPGGGVSAPTAETPEAPAPTATAPPAAAAQAETKPETPEKAEKAEKPAPTKKPGKSKPANK